MTNLEQKSQPSESQIRELWEWCEATCPNCHKPIATHDKVSVSYHPDICYCHSVQPEIDLNNLFKYAVPKLYELGWSYELAGHAYHMADLYKGERRVSSKGIPDPALALLWVIQEVIKQEEK